MKKFKKGDVVVLTSTDRHEEEKIDNWTEKSNLQVGQHFKVTRESDGWIKLSGLIFGQCGAKFKKVKSILVILRRPTDARAILKIAQQKGYRWKSGDLPLDLLHMMHGSRTITIDLNSKILTKDICSMYGEYDFSPKEIIKAAPKVLELEDYEILTIKTKPSLKTAVNQLDLYL